MILPDNYRASKLIPYGLGGLLPEDSARWLTFCILPTNSRLSSFYVCQLSSIRKLAICGSLSVPCSIKSPCNILYKTSYLHLFILTLTHSEAQEALRLLTFGRNLGGSLGLFVIRHNSRFGIYRQLLLHHPITLVIRHLIGVLSFDWNWHRHYSASFGIDQYCSVSFSIPSA